MFTSTFLMESLVVSPWTCHLRVERASFSSAIWAKMTLEAYPPSALRHETGDLFVPRRHVVLVDHGAPAVHDGVPDVDPPVVCSTVEGLRHARGVIHELYHEGHMLYDAGLPAFQELLYMVFP